MGPSDQAGKRLAPAPWPVQPIDSSHSHGSFILSSYLSPLATYTRILRLQEGALATCIPDWRQYKPSCPGILGAFWSTIPMHF